MLPSAQEQVKNSMSDAPALFQAVARPPKVLTVAAVQKFRPHRKRREIRDGGAPGLFLIIQPSGAKSWAMRFRRPDGTPAKLTLGPVDFSGRELSGDPVIGMPLTLTAARQLASAVHRQRA